MLRNTKSSRSLRHRKSSSYEPIDPAISRQHALAAATLAYARAQQMKHTDHRPSRGLSGHGSVQAQNKEGVHLRNHVESQASHPCELEPSTSIADSASLLAPENSIQRSKSIRFAGPSAQVNSRKTLRAPPSSRPLIRSPLSEQHSIASLRLGRALTNTTSVPARYIPPTRSSSVGKTTCWSQTDSYTQSLGASLDQFRAENEVAYTLSPDREIRQSRSTVSEVQNSTVVFHDGSPSVFQSPPTPCTHQPSISTRIRNSKSMTFLRGIPVKAQHLTNDAAVQLARDKFLRNIEEQRLREQPSFIFSSRAQRQERSFPTSLRASSNGYGFPVSSTSIPEDDQRNSANHGVGNKARKVSHNLKKRIKGLFGKKRSDGCAEIPVQQIDAESTHDSFLVTLKHRSSMRKDKTRASTELSDAPLSITPDGIPNDRALPLNDQLESRKVSQASSKSESGVSSWNDESMNSRCTAAERENERQRLSIINENGEHASCTFSRRRAQTLARIKLNHPFPRLERDGSRGTFIDRDHIAHPVQAIDPQTLYSVLKRRLDENSPESKLAQRAAGGDRIDGNFVGAEGKKQFRVPPRTSSIDGLRTMARSTSNTPVTIRQVREVDLESVRELDEHSFVKRHSRVGGSPLSEDDVFTTAKTTMSGASQPLQMFRNPSLSAKQSTHPTCRKENSVSPNQTSSHFQLDNQRLPQIRIEHESASPSDSVMRHKCELSSTKSFRLIREVGSGMFGSTQIMIERSQSPYRRALAEHGMLNPMSSFPRSESLLSPSPSPIQVTRAFPVANCVAGAASLRTTYENSLSSGVEKANHPSPNRSIVPDYDPAVITGNNPIVSRQNTPAAGMDQVELETVRFGASLELAREMTPGVDNESNERLLSDRRGGLYSESLYSRSEGGRTPALPDVERDLGMYPIPISRQPILGDRGEVTIIERSTYVPKPKPTVENTDPKLATRIRREHQKSTSNGSTEWRKWIGSELAALERSKSLDIGSNSVITTNTCSIESATSHPSPQQQLDDGMRESRWVSAGQATDVHVRNVPSGHRREHAQRSISDEEKSGRIKQNMSSAPIQPSGVVRHLQSMLTMHPISRAEPKVQPPSWLRSQQIRALQAQNFETKAPIKHHRSFSTQSGANVRSLVQESQKQIQQVVGQESPTSSTVRDHDVPPGIEPLSAMQVVSMCPPPSTPPPPPVPPPLPPSSPLRHAQNLRLFPTPPCSARTAVSSSPTSRKQEPISPRQLRMQRSNLTTKSARSMKSSWSADSDSIGASIRGVGVRKLAKRRGGNAGSVSNDYRGPQGQVTSSFSISVTNEKPRGLMDHHVLGSGDRVITAAVGEAVIQKPQTNENANPNIAKHETGRNNHEVGNSRGFKRLHSPSRKMVDLFLSERRRRLGSGSGDGAENSNAFI